ncbi:MAG: hypothetical protein KDF65_07770 [Anaerolineae bacterium]|nr:hypothetical protein [Anaerolineae bacterium]
MGQKPKKTKLEQTVTSGKLSQEAMEGGQLYVWIHRRAEYLRRQQRPQGGKEEKE